MLIGLLVVYAALVGVIVVDLLKIIEYCDTVLYAVA